MTQTSTNGVNGVNTPAPQAGTGLTTVKKTIEELSIMTLDHYSTLVKDGVLVTPPNYVPGNAMKLAFLALQDIKDRNDKPVLEVCTKQSIANALLKMLIKGLSIAKHQCYFIPYGTTLTMMEDYRGNLMIAKRDAGIKEINANVVYEGDEFEYLVDTKTGRKVLVKHIPKMENQIISKIKGAYAISIGDDGETNLEVMTMDQIKASWAMGQSYGSGKSKAHNNFTDQMVLKTIMNRASKIAIGSSDDEGILPTNADGEQDELTKARDIKIEKAGNKTLAIGDDTAYEVVQTQPDKQDQAPAQTVTNEGPGY